MQFMSNLPANSKDMKLSTTLKYNKIHDPRTGQFSATGSSGGKKETPSRRSTAVDVTAGTRGREAYPLMGTTGSASSYKPERMQLEKFIKSPFMGDKNGLVKKALSELKIGASVDGWTKVQGKSGVYWRKGDSTTTELNPSIVGTALHKSIIKNAVLKGKLPAVKAISLHKGQYNNIANWPSIIKMLPKKAKEKEFFFEPMPGEMIPSKGSKPDASINSVSTKAFTPKKKLRNQGKGFGGSKKLPVPESGAANNYSMTGKPVPPPRLFVISAATLNQKLSDAEKERVNKMTGNTVVAAGAKWKKESKNGSTVFQRIMQVFDNMRDYSTPERPFLSAAKKYTHRNPVTKKENKGLWFNIRAKKKRGERPAKRGHEDYPDKLSFQNSAKTSKKELDKGEYDEEGGMAKSQLQSIIRNAKAIYDGLEDDTNISEWAQSKITVAEDYISTVSNYMQGESEKTSSKESARDYRKEYDNYHGRPEQIKRRNMRNSARKTMGLKVGDPREIDHKVPLSKNGTNDLRNLRAVSFQENRSKGTRTIKELINSSFFARGADVSITSVEVDNFLRNR